MDDCRSGNWNWIGDLSCGYLNRMRVFKISNISCREEKSGICFDRVIFSLNWKGFHFMMEVVFSEKFMTKVFFVLCWCITIRYRLSAKYWNSIYFVGQLLQAKPKHLFGLTINWWLQNGQRLLNCRLIIGRGLGRLRYR